MEPAALRSPRADQPVAVRARWVLPVDGPPLADAVVTIARGRIVAVGENTSGQAAQDLGNVVLMPGLVNAHTHLEFSVLDKPLGQSGMSFAAWVGRVIEYRKQRARAMMIETDGFVRHRRLAAQTGLKELRTCGTVAAGEIAPLDWPRECFPAQGMYIVLFVELLGLAPAEREPLLAKAASFISEVYDDTAPSLRPGLSPHAPYTASPELVQRACELSARERVPVAMHLAESREELELLASHSGPLVEQLELAKAWHPEAVPRGQRPLDYLRTLAGAHQALVIHGNYLARDEIEFLAAHRDRMSVIYCPRTHAYFGHEPYPLAEMLAAGVHVAVGTDSRATNPDLRLLEELRQVAQHHSGISPENILRLGTLSAAEALGLADQFGSISVGKRAELSVVPLADGGQPPLEAVLFSRGRASDAVSLADILRGPSSS